MTCVVFNMKNKSTSLDKENSNHIFFPQFLFKMKVWPSKNVHLRMNGCFFVFMGVRGRVPGMRVKWVGPASTWSMLTSIFSRSSKRADVLCDLLIFGQCDAISFAHLRFTFQGTSRLLILKCG